MEEPDRGDGGGVVVQGGDEVVVAAGVEDVDQAIARGGGQEAGKCKEKERKML